MPAIALAAALVVFPRSSLANCGNDKPVGNGCAHGAPAPLTGAGLPRLAIAIGVGAIGLRVATAMADLSKVHAPD